MAGATPDERYMGELERVLAAQQARQEGLVNRVGVLVGTVALVVALLASNLSLVGGWWWVLPGGLAFAGLVVLVVMVSDPPCIQCPAADRLEDWHDHHAGSFSVLLTQFLRDATDVNAGRVARTVNLFRWQVFLMGASLVAAAWLSWSAR